MEKFAWIKSSKYFFAGVALASLVGFSVIVYAAAPSGGYNPGATLDPDCAPGDVSPNPCIVNVPASSSVTGGNGLSFDENRVLGLGGTLTADTTIENAGYNLELSGNGGLGINDPTGDADLTIKDSGLLVPWISSYPNSGLSDMTVSGTSIYDGGLSLWITSTGSVDTFSVAGGGFGNSIAGIQDVPITGDEQELGTSGIFVKFGSVTGHTVGENWNVNTKYKSLLLVRSQSNASLLSLDANRFILGNPLGYGNENFAVDLADGNLRRIRGGEL